MGAIATTLGNLAKPLVLGLIMLVALGLLSSDPASGNRGATGFDCRGFTDSPELNRTICRFSPSRIWNTPVVELVPWLAPKEPAPGS
ncbi:hypothetical protein [Tropicimonas sediminicola]|uniref:Uncharacterized protein n=1 Tax=Tropicimonas sediminicola TaxID=1031541 RepID=A0A239I6Z2_9RHOB|nr:hypothetical protein [Tropicimonas sediminicola]SNS89251.1 hypothetical protein SAMN05421757_104243 [Tropicimonas sediminicola]